MPKRLRPEDDPIHGVASRGCRGTAAAARAASGAIHGRKVDDNKPLKLELDHPLNRAFHDRPMADDRCSVAAEAEHRLEIIRKLVCRHFLKGVPSADRLTQISADTGPAFEAPGTVGPATHVAALGSGPHTTLSVDGADNPRPNQRSEDTSVRHLLQLFAKTPAWANFGDDLEAYFARVGCFLRTEPPNSTRFSKFLVDILDRILQVDQAYGSTELPVKRPASLPPLPPVPDDDDGLTSQPEARELNRDVEGLNSNRSLPRSPSLQRTANTQVADDVANCTRREERLQPPAPESVDFVINSMLRWRWRHEAAKVVGGQLSLQHLLDWRRESRKASPSMKTSTKRRLGDDDDDVVVAASGDNDDNRNTVNNHTHGDLDPFWAELLRNEQAFKAAAASACNAGAMASPFNLSSNDSDVNPLPRINPDDNSLSAKSLLELAARLGFLCPTSSTSNDTNTNTLYETLRKFMAAKETPTSTLDALKVPAEPSPGLCSGSTPTNCLQEALDNFEGAATGARSSPADRVQPSRRSSATEFSLSELSPSSMVSIDDDDAMFLSNLLMSPAGRTTSPRIIMAQKSDVDEPVNRIKPNRSSHSNCSKSPSTKANYIRLNRRTDQVKVASLQPEFNCVAPKPRRVTTGDDRHGTRNIGKTPKNAKFPGKLREILTTKQYEHIIAWDDNLSGIIVKDGSLFLSEIAPYFFCSNSPGDGPLDLFYRQLNYYGFKRVKDLHVLPELNVEPIAGARYFINRDPSIKSVHDLTNVKRYIPEQQRSQKAKQARKRRRS